MKTKIKKLILLTFTMMIFMANVNMTTLYAKPVTKLEICDLDSSKNFSPLNGSFVSDRYIFYQRYFKAVKSDNSTNKIYYRYDTVTGKTKKFTFDYRRVSTPMAYYDKNYYFSNDLESIYMFSKDFSKTKLIVSNKNNSNTELMLNFVFKNDVYYGICPWNENSSNNFYELRKYNIKTKKDTRIKYYHLKKGQFVLVHLYKGKILTRKVIRFPAFDSAPEADDFEIYKDLKGNKYKIRALDLLDGEEVDNLVRQNNGVYYTDWNTIYFRPNSDSNNNTTETDENRDIVIKKFKNHVGEINVNGHNMFVEVYYEHSIKGSYKFKHFHKYYYINLENKECKLIDECSYIE